MGGNALKNVPTRRYQRDEYLKLEAEVLDMIRRDFPKSRVETIRAYRQKDSFGDMDVLFESDFLQEDLMKYVQRRFNTKEAVRNSNVVSFEYKEFQIDLIGTHMLNFETSVNYFAWNDLGNLMGRIAHKLGFKYGHEGLSLVLRDGTHQYAEINLSRDSQSIVEFLGYEYARFAKGFDTVDEIFNFTVSTPFFNKDIYALENRNHTSRTRDKKRKTYREFLEWIEIADDLPKYPWESLKEQGGPQYKERFIQRAFQFFPDFKETFEVIQANFEVWKKAKSMYNGDLVRGWLGLDGMELGRFMKHVKDLGQDFEPDWQHWVVLHSQEDVKEWVMAVYKDFKTV